MVDGQNLETNGPRRGGLHSRGVTLEEEGSGGD